MSYVDTDDSLVLISKNGFGNVFNGRTLSIASDYDTRLYCTYSSNTISSCIWRDSGSSELIIYDGPANIDQSSVIRYTYLFGGNPRFYLSRDFFIDFYEGKIIDTRFDNVKMVRLKPCMKIMSGSGTVDNPYQLEATGECKYRKEIVYIQ